jgi:ubiquinone/menaquinone biosynthesis C-methylase UbiE
VSEQLPEPEVSAAEYDTSYYLQSCGGHEEWVESDGQVVNGMYPGALRRAGLREGEVVVDIGTGRGELLAVAVEQGASKAIGIEYSADAVALAEKTIATHGVGDRAEVLLVDARSIPLEDGVADLVTMLDVVEHLSPAELDASLREAHRLLRPGGRILIHTFPTSTIFKVYKLQRRLVPGRAARWPADPRHPLEILMHINEQTAPRLTKSLRAAGFDGRATLGEWIFTDYVPESDAKARRLYHRFARFKPTRRFGVANLWGDGVKR